MTRLVSAAFLVMPFAIAAEERPRPPQGPPGTVTLPLAEYDRLMDRAARPPKRPEPPPVSAVLSRAEARLRVVDGAARGTLTLEGEVFRAGPAKVPLVAGPTVLDARLQGRPLPLLVEDGAHAAIVSGPGPYSIALDWGTPITTEPGRASFFLPVPQAGSVHATLEVPGEQADVRLEPGLITRRMAAAGRTTIEATLDPGSRARFSWSMREGAAAPAPRDARFLADLKTLVTVGEAELGLAALVDVTVVQGEPERFALRLPSGYEVTGASGSSLEKTEDAAGLLTLVVRGTARGRHQFLVTLERGTPGGTFKDGVSLPSLDGAQRETGEVAIESVGTMEVAATEEGELRRMDVREASATLKGLARQPLLAAFRYHHRGRELPRVALDVERFPDAAVLAALAERAQVTTLVTTEGRILTEVSLTVRNRAQPFLKVGLPEGATLLSAEVAGEAVKPAKGDDGTRVPLLRTGFRPSGLYAVSFVYLHPGARFAKRGEAALEVPRMDVPVSLLEWELFLPEGYRIKDFGGNALPGALAGVPGGLVNGLPGGIDSGVVAEGETMLGADQALPAARGDIERQRSEAAQQNVPSANVLSLQRRVAGVLPVRVDIPRAGVSYRFVRPLVLDEETTVRFQYRRR